MSFSDLLCDVRHPSRYTGGEFNAVVKDPAAVLCRVALIYPDLYDLGMSYLGLQVLYQALNAQPDIWAERVFAPDLDMQAALERAGLPLASLESGTALSDFDMLGFTLQHELNYPDVLAILGMGGIPLHAAQRGPRHPLVVAGGPGAANPEPLAQALDAVFLGDGEQGALELARAVGEGRRQDLSREEILDRLMEIPGVYIPSRYEMSRGPDGTFERLTPIRGAPPVVRRRLIADINQLSLPDRPIVPSQTVHDRLTVEIQRGCTRGCRFCQAGMINRPVRQRSASRILDAVDAGLAGSGHGEVSFLSLSAGDHPNIQRILEEFFARHADERIAASLPSLRADTLTPGLARIIKTVRKSGFTIAPEAGSERLRAVINKNISDEDILSAADGAFAAGWRLIKLYFMVGLPTETERDRDAIVEMVSRIRRLYRSRGSGGRINVGISTFVPKTHTPFQWERMITAAEASAIHASLKSRLSALPGVKVGRAPTDMSQAEGILSRGDRRLFAALENLAQAGQRLAGWSEHFDQQKFARAFAPLAPGGSLGGLLGERRLDDPLPWDHLDMGPDKEFLLAERERALAGESSPDCAMDGCYDCGACRDEDAAPVLDGQMPGASHVPDLAADGRDPARIRLVLAKEGPAACLSHIEFMGQLTKAVRRAGWPLSHSRGFHPKPRMSFGPACQVGVSSLCEMVDVALAKLGPDDPPALLERLAATLPGGMRLLEGAPLSEGAPSVMRRLVAVDYIMHSPDASDRESILEAIREILARSIWNHSRIVKGSRKTVDLRPSIKRLELLDSLSAEAGVPAKAERVHCELWLNRGSSARPYEMAREIWGDARVVIVRQALLFLDDIHREDTKT
ncbi:MAG TPA: TIGR03960 family B12-binding radical SAM protein [Myxococcota bacterium]|nr:TIGR03960 family B12-binding radical SAM protein [Myxococcota bacterium]